MEKCSICDHELTIEDNALRGAYDSMVVCKDHRKYANYWIPEVAKMELGLITEYPDRLKKCRICGDASEPISNTTLNPVCTKHKAAENMFNMDWARKWFVFAETQPQPFEDNDENRSKFLAYRVDKENQKTN